MQDVFYFAFDFLQYITHTKFSLQTAVDMRRRKREVEAELVVERSASPAETRAAVSATGPRDRTSNPRTDAATTAGAAVAAPAAPVRQRSALTSALRSQAAKGKRSTNSQTDVGADAASPDDCDDDRAPLVVAGSAASSAGFLQGPLPLSATPSSSANPAPSLASFIIDDEHAGQQQPASVQQSARAAGPVGDDASSTPAADSASEAASPSDAGEDGEGKERSLPPYLPTARAMPIPVRKASATVTSDSDATGAAHAVRADGDSEGRGSNGFEAPTASGSVGERSNGVTASSSMAPAQMSRVNSWTLIADKHTPPPNVQQQQQQQRFGSDSLPSSSSSGGASSSSSSPSASFGGCSSSSVPGSAAPSASSFPYSSSEAGPASASARAASARRCDRLLEVRSLFMTMYHSTLPSTAPAPNPPHAASAAAAAAKTAGQIRQSNSSSNSSNSSSATSTRPPAPIAAPVARATAPSASWFSR